MSYSSSCYIAFFFLYPLMAFHIMYFKIWTITSNNVQMSLPTKLVPIGNAFFMHIPQCTLIGSIPRIFNSRLAKSAFFCGLLSHQQIRLFSEPPSFISLSKLARSAYSLLIAVVFSRKHFSEPPQIGKGCHTCLIQFNLWRSQSHSWQKLDSSKLVWWQIYLNLIFGMNGDRKSLSNNPYWSQWMCIMKYVQIVYSQI